MSALLWCAAALAQSPTPPPVAPAAAPSADPAGDASLLIPGIPPGPPPPADEVQNRAYKIGAKLRCPVCQGLSVADSTSAAAVQMQLRIRELVAAGYEEPEIRAFFVERYGEWIELEPNITGLNLMIWVAPGLLGGLGIAWAASLMLKWRKETDEVPLPSDLGLVPKDPYEQRLLAELED
ncbi:MAG: cytochrome c-type biogenesis protein CcmH [Myxococcota bacterium]